METKIIKKKKCVSICLIMLFILNIATSCIYDKKGYKRVLDDTTFSVNKELLLYVDRYIKRYPQYSSLTILTELEYNWREEYKENCILLIGPSFDGLFEKERIYPSYTFEYRKRKVFIQSSSDYLYEQKSRERTYHQYSVKNIKKEEDIISYLKLALVVKAIGKGSFIYVTDKADSLILRKRVKFIPPSV
jgi:hypothetical protein